MNTPVFLGTKSRHAKSWEYPIIILCNFQISIPPFNIKPYTNGIKIQKSCIHYINCLASHLLDRIRCYNSVFLQNWKWFPESKVMIEGWIVSPNFFHQTGPSHFAEVDADIWFCGSWSNVIIESSKWSTWFNLSRSFGKSKPWISCVYFCARNELPYIMHCIADVDS